MSVNGTELAIGQRWKNRWGEEVEVISFDNSAAYPWGLSNGDTVTDEGLEWELTKSDGDLVTLVQDEHGFIPWNGGECPVGYGVKVEYKMKSGPSEVFEGFPDGLRWEHIGSGGDIIAYRVVKKEVKPAKVDAEEEPKYTVDEVLQAFVLLTGRYAYTTDEVATVKKICKLLDKTQDPDYKLYLELKAKFE